MALLLKWQKTTNLVASSTLPYLWTRHIADSLQLPALAPGARRWIDLGAGAGFPGLVIACALAESPVQVHLVESNQKKVGVPARGDPYPRSAGHCACSANRGLLPAIEEPFDVVTARALAPLDKLIGYAIPLLKTGALGCFPRDKM